MGQRLNAAVVLGGKTIFNCYFHWGAYTRSALRIAKLFMDEYAHVYEMLEDDVRQGRIKTMPNRKTMALTTALRAWVGSGIDEKASLASKRLFGDELRSLLRKKGFDPNIVPCAVGTDRNDGLICITEDGIASNEKAEEYRLEIEIGLSGKSKIVRFDVWDMETISTYEEDTGEKPEYLEVGTGVLKYYRDPIISQRVDEILKLLDEAPGFAIGCEAEDRMLVEVL